MKTAPVDQIADLYKDAGWWTTEYDRNPGFLNKIVENSALFAGAFYQERLIGMGRALSDKASDAYVQDVIVLKDFRGKGMGKKIINTLIDELKELGVDWIGLIGKPGTELFYEKIGFKRLPGHVPFKYEG